MLRGAGWTFIAAGLLVLLYVVYSLLFTNLEARAAQAALLKEWQLEVGDAALPASTDARQAANTDPPELPGEPTAATTKPPPVQPGDAVAVLAFERPGAAQPLVHAEPLFVVEGVALDDLQRGPGHYPDTSLPGQPGNFAVAGHRTTYGAPFFHLDQVQHGDIVWVTDRTGTRWRYEIVEQRVVAPAAVSVLEPDPLGNGRPTLTLTTCHPRFSNRERLVVFAQLASP